MLDSKGCDSNTKSSRRTVTSGVPQWSVLTQVSTAQHLYYRFGDGTGCTLSKSAGNIIWEQGLMHQRIVLTFRETLQAGGLGQEEPHEVQEREMSTPAPGEK